MPKDKFGHGQTTCKVCGVKLADIKPVNLKLKHTTGAMLVEVKYYPPLCDAHRGDGHLDVDIGWDAGVVSTDVMKDP